MCAKSANARALHSQPVRVDCDVLNLVDAKPCNRFKLNPLRRFLQRIYVQGKCVPQTGTNICIDIVNDYDRNVIDRMNENLRRNKVENNKLFNHSITTSHTRPATVFTPCMHVVLPLMDQCHRQCAVREIESHFFSLFSFFFHFIFL